MSHRAVPSSEPDRQSDVEGLLGALRAATPARVGLGRAGAGLPTAAMLEFQLAHAKARDAVWAELDTEALRAALPGPSLVIASAAPDRRTFLLDPERGRRLDPHGAPLPQTRADLAILIADGLCAAAVQAQAPLLLRALLPRLFDLHALVKRYVRHPGFRGRTSLKVVLPALADDVTYEELAVRDGATATLRYEAATRGGLSESERGRIFADLRAYCAVDTLALVRVVQALAEQAGISLRRGPGATAPPRSVPAAR